MDARAVLAVLRDGQSPDVDALKWFVNGLVDGTVDDAQAGAFAMGICRTPLTLQARLALTHAMRDSGKVLTWDLPGPVMDKHSTGGIGDPLSLILGPAIAAVGGFIPMLSGRGLGHTGGTLDKLEAIPGLSTELGDDQFRNVVTQTGCAVAAASAEIAPADRRLYAVRDVTSTVPSIDLITASILSKKLAGGVGPLILDVKLGSGAFMTQQSEAEELATSLVTTANGVSGPAAALITDMNQPCVPSLGNALEIMEVMGCLTQSHQNDAFALTTALGGELMCLAGMVETVSEGAEKIANALTSGKAAERFGQMVSAMGGPVDFLERWPDRLPAAPVVREIVATRSGYLTAMDGQALGMGVVHLGGGRQKAGDVIDPAVGLSDVLRLGDPIEKGDPLAIIHGSDVDTTERIAATLAGAFTIGDDQEPKPELIKERIA